MFKESSCETVVCDLLTGQQHHVASPPVMSLDDGECWDAATVLCADAEDGHVHGESGIFFSAEISEISPETGFLVPLREILIPFKKFGLI